MKKDGFHLREGINKKEICSRCQGMMVDEWVFTDEGEIAMARCIRCGNLIDSLVLSNRSARTSPSDDEGRKKTMKKSPGCAKPLAA